jgi:hypothetical protein
MKFKAGQRIKYIGTKQTSNISKIDIGKIGIIVDVDYSRGDLFIYLPTSDNISYYSPRKGKPVSWQTSFDSVKLLNNEEENGQLLFEFMYNEV